MSKTKSKTPSRQAVTEEAPTIDELVAQDAETPTIDEIAGQAEEAPTIDEIAEQAPAIEQDEPEPASPMELPLDALAMIVWVGPQGERFHLEPWKTRGEYQLRPYFGD